MIFQRVYYICCVVIKYTVSEYAKKMNVSRWTVYRMVKMKLLPPGTSAKTFLTRIYIEAKTSE